MHHTHILMFKVIIGPINKHYAFSEVKVRTATVTRKDIGDEELDVILDEIIVERRESGF